MRKTRPSLRLLFAALLPLAMAGCSPHPATGTWTTEREPDSGFDRLEITYEGRAHLYEVGEKEAGRRCFWGGESAQAIAMTCKPASDTNIDERYQLIVEENGTATLLRDGKVAARFSRQAR